MALKTIFKTIVIPTTALNQGIPIGQGKCKAVLLRLNNTILNNSAGTLIPVAERNVYYGDANGQFFELTNGQTSELILCEDLSEVYIRGNGTLNRIQAMIYVDEQ